MTTGTIWGRRGDTRAWRRLREMYGRSLPLPCWRCGRMIRPGQAWSLGHLVDRWVGGTDDRLAPEHRRCSDESGGRAARAAMRWRRVMAEQGRPVPPSASAARNRAATARRTARAGPSRRWLAR
jgi:hypothetical protein